MLENVCWGHVHVVVTTWCCLQVSNVPSPMEICVKKHQEAWGIETPPGICLRPTTAREASVQSSGAMMRGRFQRCTLEYLRYEPTWTPAVTRSTARAAGNTSAGRSGTLSLPKSVGTGGGSRTPVLASSAFKNSSSARTRSRDLPLAASAATEDSVPRCEFQCTSEWPKTSAGQEPECARAPHRPWPCAGLLPCAERVSSEGRGSRLEPRRGA